jgi:hypothetical protein
VPKKTEQTGGQEGGLTQTRDSNAAPANGENPGRRVEICAACIRVAQWARSLGLQQKTAVALVFLSALIIAGAGAWFAPDPVSGAMRSLLMALIQSTYIALIALSAWLLVGHRTNITYALCFGLAVAVTTAWTIVSSVEDYRLRMEANETIVTFRDSPLNLVGLAGIVERNPYVGAYMVMREAHWDLQDRLKRRVDHYRGEYERYAEPASFLAIERLRSRYELWRAFYQIQELESLLDQIEKTPLETTDLVWTVNLLEVDAGTKAAYKRDLETSISAARAWQSDFIELEKRTLRQIRRALKVVIDAEGRYRFAEGHIVFEDPRDAAMFSGKEPRDDKALR